MRELGATTRGVWTRAQALELVSRAVVRGRVAGGTWQRPWPGVYADAGVVLDAEQRALAAVLASGGGLEPDRRLRAAACGRTAARVHGFVLVDDDDPVTGGREHLLDEVAVQEHVRPLVAPDGRMLQRRELVRQERDLVRRPSGLVLTSRVRTVLDCAALLEPDALVCLLDDALHRGMVARGALAERAARVGGRPARRCGAGWTWRTSGPSRRARPWRGCCSGRCCPGWSRRCRCSTGSAGSWPGSTWPRRSAASPSRWTGAWGTLAT